MRRALTIALLVGGLALAPLALHGQAEESLGTKIKRVFQPTPPPKKKKKKHTRTRRKKAATPAPSASPTPETSPSPSPSPSPSATPTASPSPSPSPKKGSKKKASPTPSPSPSPSASPSPSPSAAPSPNEKKEKPAGASISTSDLAGFDEYPEPVRKLIATALELTTRNLSYKYGSADPKAGGMDCSGFIFFVLQENGFTEVPRDASGQYTWVRKTGKFEAVVSRKDDTFELAKLKPGDLLFWSGTYDVERDPPVTHTMIYLGKEKGTGRRIMVGSSDGRTYHDESRFGVGVFDFRVARPGHPATNGRTPDFVGYGPIPGLGDG